MKKLLLVLAIGTTIAACNNNADSTKPADSTVAPVVVDTNKTVVVDTMKHDSLAPAKVDSLKK